MLLYGKEIPTHAGAIAANQRDAGKRDDAKQVEDAFGMSGYRLAHGLLKREHKKEGQGIPKSRGLKPQKIGGIQVRK